MNFTKWFDTFVSEKGLNTEHIFEIEDPDSLFGNHIVPFEVFREFICGTPAEIKSQVKTQIVKIDFVNGDVMDFFEYLVCWMVGAPAPAQKVEVE